MKRPLTAVFLLLILAAIATHARAHGGGALIAGPVPVGPYVVSVWLNPPQPRAGEPLHFTVGLAAPQDGAPILDAAILVTMRATPEADPITAPATTEQSINRLFYETDMEVPVAGQYETLFQISGPAGTGDLDLAVEVREPSPVNWLYVGLGGLALVVLGGLWRARRAKGTA